MEEAFFKKDDYARTIYKAGVVLGATDPEGRARALVALASTMTSSIRCDGVVMPKDSVLRVGKQVLARGNHLPLAQVYLAMGLCRGAIDLISEYRSPVAEKARERFGGQLVRLRDEVIGLSQAGREAEATSAAPVIRGRCNDLVLRATHAAVTLYKGTGLLAGHPAQRMARKALFLLVWSCPTPVIDCTVDLLTVVAGGGVPAAVEVEGVAVGPVGHGGVLLRFLRCVRWARCGGHGAPRWATTPRRLRPERRSAKPWLISSRG